MKVYRYAMLSTRVRSIFLVFYIIFTNTNCWNSLLKMLMSNKICPSTRHLHEKCIDELDIVSTKLLRNNNTSNLDSIIEQRFLDCDINIMFFWIIVWFRFAANDNIKFEYRRNVFLRILPPPKIVNLSTHFYSVPLWKVSVFVFDLLPM